jgi:bacteriorhodopsin
MRRLLEWMFYAIGFVAILYLALYAYAIFRGREFVPGDPIRIFRNPEAPDYS